ncbi:MAG: hypothetical protein JXA25_12755 [Anaerolineales bacterium]|nr:hypothetical protein [Anaerolineales bacterium]
MICAISALPGPIQLAETAVEVLGERHRVPLPDRRAHIAKRDLKHALTICHTVKNNARIYILARNIGTPNLLFQESYQNPGGACSDRI